MKKYILLICLAGFLQFTTAQEKRYFDSPFGGGGGFLPSWFMPKFDGVNDQLAAFGTPALNKNGFYASGGAGFAYIGIIPNLRVGGIGFGGSVNSKGLKDGYEREVVYSSNFGGITVEYTVPISRAFAVSVGGIIGGGETTIELFRNKTPNNWGSVWTNISDTSGSNSNFMRKISKSDLVVAPTLNIDIPIYRFFSLRIGAGYAFNFGGDWTVDNEKELFGTPNTVTGNTFFIQTGIFFGFFAY